MPRGRHPYQFAREGGRVVAAALLKQKAADVKTQTTEKPMSMIREVEQKVVRRFVKDAIKAGKRLAVSLERGYDVDEMLLGSTDVKKIMDEAFAGDEAHIFVQPGEGPTVESGLVISEGWVYIVLGNEGYDVINDYTVNLEDLLKGANKVAERYEN